MLLRFSLKLVKSVLHLILLMSDDQSLEKYGENDFEKVIDLCRNLTYLVTVLVLFRLILKLGIRALTTGRVKFKCILWNTVRPRNLAL